MKRIIWNQVTWYSKFLAFIVLLGAFPALTFYIGEKYNQAVDQYGGAEVYNKAAHDAGL